ncbi:MAG: hypothetical protein JWN04_526, partial [Myxococcaceae bacterium]|nr:hypothetical protein [Myxococcaceae bacterium]
SFDYGYYGERTETWPLRLLPVSFGLLLVLGAVGFAGAVRHKKVLALAPLLAVALGTLLTTTLFHPSTRYRLPLLILLLPLAGYAWQLALSLRAPRLRLSAVAVLSGVCLCFAIRQAVHPLDRPALWQLRVAEAAVEEGNFAVARRRIEAAHALAPDDPQVTGYAERLTRRLPTPAKVD